MSVIFVKYIRGRSQNDDRMRHSIHIFDYIDYWWSIITYYPTISYDDDGNEEKCEYNVVIVTGNHLKSDWAIRSSYFARYMKGGLQ